MSYLKIHFLMIDWIILLNKTHIYINVLRTHLSELVMQYIFQIKYILVISYPICYQKRRDCWKY